MKPARSCVAQKRSPVNLPINYRAPPKSFALWDTPTRTAEIAIWELHSHLDCASIRYKARNESLPRSGDFEQRRLLFRKILTQNKCDNTRKHLNDCKLFLLQLKVLLHIV